MGFPINGDLVPSVSGRAHLGVDGGPNLGAFDLTPGAVRPFGHIHQVSGVFHDPLHGQSGVLRFNQQLDCFEVSTDGGLTFDCVTTTATAGGVTSVGVVGGANLTGAVDFAFPVSGFILIEDNAGASPLSWGVNTLALSGLWDFPTQGFNGRVVNALTDSNGTESQGVINVVGASGIIVDIIGQTMTVAGDKTVARCYAETFGAATSWVATHSLATLDVSVMVLDDSSPRVEILPDEVEITDANNVTISFNVAQGGRVVILGC
jgi:hypothetical protein